MRANQSTHPWAGLKPETLLKKAGFYKKDSATGKKGYTLADEVPAILHQRRKTGIYRRGYVFRGCTGGWRRSLRSREG